jgi:hypothetical protein
MIKPILFKNARPVKSIFGLLGYDENAFTFALGYTLQQSTHFMQNILNILNIKGLRKSTLNKAEIYLQKYDENSEGGGRTDLEIIIKNRLHLILEAKVNFNIPSIEQCIKYVDRLQNTLRNSPSTKCKLVMLLDIDPKPTIELYHKKNIELKTLLDGLYWADIFEKSQSAINKEVSSSVENYSLKQFGIFIEKELNMKSYTDEIWVVPTNKHPLWKEGWSFYDTHLKGQIYYRKKKDGYTNVKPLYIAFRCNGKVEFIQRVVKIEHEIPVIDVLPQLGNIRTRWPSEPHTIWHLDKPVKLPHAIPVKDRTIQQLPTSYDIDVLLTAPSIKDARVLMQKRKI